MISWFGQERSERRESKEFNGIVKYGNDVVAPNTYRMADTLETARRQEYIFITLK